METAVFDRLENLNQSTTNWTIKVRVTRKWPSVTAETASLKGFNLILLDDDNNHIHAFAYHNIWNALTTAVVEGGVYVINQFSVKDAVGNLKPVQTKFCIRLTTGTTVKEAEDDDTIPLQKFEFLDLGDLFAEANKCQPREQPEFVIDVIGVLEEYENVRRINTKYGDKEIVKFRICDSRINDYSNSHKVTVWGDLAVSVEDMYGKELEKPIIAIVSGTKVTTFMNSVQIGTLPSSKVFLNLDDESVTDMRLRLKGEQYELKAGKFIQSTNSEVVPSFFEKLTLRDLNEKLTYDHLKKKICCTFTIIKVEEESNWWFYSCNKCSSEVESIDTRFKCTNCPRIIPVAPRKFRVMVLAQDSTFACNVLLEDRPARRILGTSAAKMVSDLIKVPKEGIPKLLQTLVGKEISVQISLKKSNVTQDSTLFHADDLLDKSMPSPSEIPPDTSSLIVGLDDDGDEFLKTPGSAKSVTKKIKTED